MTFDGDPRLFEQGDGADILIYDGQPVMDAGLENAVYISLFSIPGWWGNLVSDGAEKIGSDFESIFSRTLTNKTRLDAEEYARQALAWLLDEGIASSISVDSAITSPGLLVLQIGITQPSGEAASLRYSLNWSAMAAQAGV